MSWVYKLVGGLTVLAVFAAGILSAVFWGPVVTVSVAVVFFLFVVVVLIEQNFYKWRQENGIEKKGARKIYAGFV